MTVRHDCDQSERVPGEHSTHLLVNTESLLSLLLFRFFKRDLNYIHYIQCLTNLCKVFNKLCKVCATAALN